MEEKKEYFLLYYGKWNSEEAVGEALPQLTYCTSIGELSDTSAKNLASKHEINYYIAGRGCKYHGFSPHDTSGEDPDEGFHAPFYEMKTRLAMPEALWNECCDAMNCFEEKEASGEHDEAIRFMQRVFQHAERIRNPSRPQSKHSFNFKDLTPDKGKWIPIGEFARLTNTDTKALENRRLVLGGIRNKNKMRGIDSEGRYWQKMGRPLKDGGKSTTKLICWYWVTHEELLQYQQRRQQQTQN